jgi:branched-chain amino acid transport system permease protein
VILVALLVRRHELTRAETGESSWDAAGILRPVPTAIARIRSFRHLRLGAGVVVAIVLVLAPAAATPSTTVLMAFAVVWAIVALSLVVLTGWGGNISLGQFAIVGAGAMAAGNVFERWNGDFFVATGLAVVVGGLLALALGVPALRIRGLYLAVTTLAFAVALDSYFLNPVNFRGSVPERIVQPMLFKRFDTGDPTVVYYLCLAGLVGVMAILLSVRHRRSGLNSLATRDNERSADALGVPTTRTKIQTFVLSGCIAGLAGSLYITVLGGVGLGTFQPTSSVNVFCYAVIGGLSSIGGAISGVALFRGIDFAVSKTVAGTAAAIIRLSLSGTGLLVVLYFLPGGLWQVVQRVRDRLLGRLYERGEEDDRRSHAPPDDEQLFTAAADGLDGAETDTDPSLTGAAR